MGDVTLSEKAQALKAAFVKRRGFWVDEYDLLLRFSPDFLEKHLEASALATTESGIEPLLSEFIAIAIDASTTHLFLSGLRLHIRAALRLGASSEQIIEVVQLVSSLGMQSNLFALPIVAELMPESDPLSNVIREPSGYVDGEFKNNFKNRFGVWNKSFELFLRTSPAYFRAYYDVLSVPYLSGALTARERALVILAVNVAVTHLNEKGISDAVEAAYAAGCSAADLVNVIRRTSSLGMHSTMVALPILQEELDAFGSAEGK